MKFKAIDFGKIIFLIFALYVSWFREAFGVHQLFLYLPIIVLTTIVGIAMLKKRILYVNEIPSIIKAFIILGVFALVTCPFVAINSSWCFSSIITFFAYTIVCFDVYYISYENRSYAWVMNILVLCGIICSLQAVFHGYEYWTSGVYAITLGPDNNPNYLGLVIIVSLFAYLYDVERVKRYFLLSLGIIALFSFVIIQTASRKNVACLAIFIIVWFVRMIQSLNITKGKSSTKDFIRLCVLVVVIICVIVVVYTQMSSSAVFEKFTKTASSGEGLSSRIFLYKEAWKLFCTHPIIGVGFDQYRFYSSIGKYSHSVYAEILSCTGLIGVVLFFRPFFLKLIEVIRMVFRTKFKDYNIMMALLMFVIEILLGLGQIYIYEFYHMIVLTIIFMISDSSKKVYCDK